MLQTFLSTIYQVFLPISLPVIGGALLRRFRGMDTKPISMLALYVLSPALIFTALFKAQISWSDITDTILFTVINIVVLWGAAIAVGKMLALPAGERAGLTMVSTFTNSVNYGLPLVLLALGQAGLDKASVYVIVQMIIVNTLGIYFAARSQFTVKNAILSVFKMPSIYAAALAAIARLTELHMPEALYKGFTLMADSYSPVVLAILGAQMIGVKRETLPPNHKKAFWAGIVIRLVAAPALAYAVLICLSVKGTLFDVMFILASMPAAVNAVLLAEQFNAAPQFVSRCILWTTLASFIVLPVILMVLRS
ncbi:AEC family transporter [Paenibacillus piri]|uniref:AEC family transporter n=1 Tax=Paenibacillus piri TaxID=2547395 RepID=A0A4R5KF45_9BACL|nr:AEC family transporter [Paenibacillus piri]TDF93305.1 AEC family transporter [Paenibacillus piri]